MKLTVCELTSPPIKRLIEQHYIPWYCDVDISTEWYYPYAYGLGSVPLPFISIIDPADSGNFLDRTTGLQDANDFYARLLLYIDYELSDVIAILQIISGMNPDPADLFDFDINDDERIGLEEVIFVLRQISTESTQ